MKYSEINWGQMEAVINKLGGIEGMNRLLGDQVELRFSPKGPRILGLELGTFPSIEALNEALASRILGGSTGQNVAPNRDLVQNIKLSEPQKIDLVIVDVQNLGFSRDVQMWEFYETAQRLGLDYCPDETAAQVILQNRIDLKTLGAHQVQFAMNPGRRNGNGFRIRENEHGQYLTRFTNRADWSRRSDEKFAFVPRK